MISAITSNNVLPEENIGYKSSIEANSDEKPHYKSNELSFSNIEPVCLKVRHLSVSSSASSQSSNPLTGYFKKRRYSDIESQEDETNSKHKTLLHPTSFDLPSGSLMALIGGSGSGKTTLLNVLANRSSSSSTLQQSGQIEYNDHHQISSIRHAYVIQQDILSPHLTTRETLRYAADLRLIDATCTEDGRRRLVEEIILELGLKDCADTLVGDNTTTHNKGLSGGEKRRLSIGIQLLSNPSLLFLDEPTTGLDASSAYMVIKTLKNLAKKGRTIVISIHQARSDIFFLFDYLCVLSRGHTVYNYKVEGEVLPYFTKLVGYDIPEGVNPADFIIDVTAVDTRSVEDERRGIENLEKFANNWKEAQEQILNDFNEDTVSTYEKKNKNKNKTTSTKKNKDDDVPPSMGNLHLVQEIKVQTRRSLLLTTRDTMTLLSLILESAIMGLICGWVFYKPDASLSGIRTTQGAIYSANGLQGYLMLLFETYRLSNSDIKVFDREYTDNCVTPLGFLISRRLAKLITEDIVVTVLFSCTTYFMFDLDPVVSKFFVYYALILLNHVTSMTCATLCVAISRNYSQASLMANLNYTLQSFAAGYFINTRRLPVYVRWLKYVAYVWYAFGAMISNQFTNFVGDCPYEDPSLCLEYNGEYIVKDLGFWLNWRTVPICVLFCWAVGMYVVAGLVLRFKKVDVSLSKQVKAAKSQTLAIKGNKANEEKTKFTEPSSSTASSSSGAIDIRLNNINLSVQTKHSLFAKKRRNDAQKVILEDINASFKSGKINAIMGPSGSGKSSLLSLISGRLSSDWTNNYSSSGSIVLNDHTTINMESMKSICSFVSQDDDHLLPTLSVFESLKLSADVRLSQQLSKSERLQIVNDIILKLGLKNCANTLIGSEFVKGISGGEKRRVSIGIQLLNNPKVLFLDEPTSGLDSFTSLSILEILQSLAKEGKTIILTIHQPRSDLFGQFGQVLLLSKGGKVAYDGDQAAMESYFAQVGFACPPLTNIADHILDLISINNQTLENEVLSRARIDQLLTKWQQHMKSTQMTMITTKAKSESIKSQDLTSLKAKSPFMKAYIASLTQLGISIIRDRQTFIARITNILGIGIILMLFCSPLSNDTVGISNRLGLIQQICSLYFCGMLNNLTSYPSQRNFFYHEYHDGVYGVLPFFLSYLTIEVPFEVVSCMIFSCFTGLVTGLPRTFPFFISLSYVAWMICLCGESLGIITNTLFMNAGFAINVVSIILSIGTFMAGLMSLQMGGFLRGINYISPLKYSIGIVLNMAFTENVTFTCDSAQECLLSNGEEVLVQYGLRVENYRFYFVVLFAIAVIYRLIAYLLLRLTLMKFNLGKLKRSN